MQGACNKDGEDCPESTSRSGEPVRLVDPVGPDEGPTRPNVPPAPPPRIDLKKRRLSSTGSVVSSGGDRSSGTIHCVDGRCRFVSKEEMAQEASAKKASKTKKKSKKKKGKMSKVGEAVVVVEPGLIFTGSSSSMDTIGVQSKAVEEEAEPTQMEREEIAKKPRETGDGGFIGPPHLQDGEEPEILMRVYERADDAAATAIAPVPTPRSPVALPSSLECEAAKQVKWDMFTSTWLSVSAKGIDIREYIATSPPSNSTAEAVRPFCDPDAADVPAVSLLSLDHLEVRVLLS